jgi:hypothetical protein
LTNPLGEGEEKSLGVGGVFGESDGPECDLSHKSIKKMINRADAKHLAKNATRV